MTVLVIGNNVWGHAEDLKKAKQNFTAHGGRLSLGYTVVEFDEGQRFAGVDQMGYVHWHNDDGSDREPKSREIKARKR